MSRVEAPLHTLTGHILAETERAIRFEIHTLNGKEHSTEDEMGDKFHKQEWFPLSQVKSITRAAPSSDDLDDLDELRVQDWLMKTKGLV